MNDVIGHFRKAVLLRDAAGLTDGQLLECFLLRRDEPAFAALVRRHGPMVMGVCRRVLGNLHDAEDAFQATFLVLARKAASVRSREVVAHWLYGVAYRTALKARATAARRRAREHQVNDMAQRDVPPDDGWRDLLPLLDQELARLPERYRVAVVLCDLEGVTRREAARRLNLPVGTLSSRLTRARQLLAKRVSRFGLAVSGGALAVALSEKTTAAAVTGALAAATTKAAALLVAGRALTAGAVPARVLALTEGVIKTMLLMKLRAVVAVAVVVCVGAGVVGLAYQTGAAEAKPTAGAPAAAGQATSDDLEALRLEVEALRKSLQATRERVRALEGQVQALGGKDGARSGVDGAGAGAEAVKPAVEAHDVAPKLRWDVEVFHYPPLVLVDDPRAQAEAALKKLEEHPDDKEAAKALEAAVQRLKERAKPQGQTGAPAKP
jgi:RNA polymerase sigma factor (sigma-70 family)